MPETIVTVTHAAGLHMRPAALFVQTAARFQSVIRVTNLDKPDNPPADARSMFSVTGLEVAQGHRILVSAEGADAEAALATLAHLVASEFTSADASSSSTTRREPAAPEQPAVAAPLAAPATASLQGIAAAPGIALGPTLLFHTAAPATVQYTVADSSAELARFAQARERAHAQIGQVRDTIARTASSEEAAIFAAHLALLDDPALIQEIETYTTRHRCNIEAAVEVVFDQQTNVLRQKENPLLQARAADLQDIKRRLLRILLNQSDTTLVLPDTPCIIVADELLPSETVLLDQTRVKGFCTARGGATAHVAILARGLGLPAVVGVGAAILDLPDATAVIVDGSSGEVHVQPSEALADTYRARALAEQARQAQQRMTASLPAVTRDNARIEVAANIGRASEIQVAIENGAEGVGLLRTELLFVDRTVAPGEEEQLRLYRACAEALGQRPLIIRTLDIGSDKPVPYLSLSSEHNPALGLRGVRLVRMAPELLRTQLRAIWRIGPACNVKVMFPMVTCLEEVYMLRELVAEVGAEVRREQHAVVDRLDIGIMVETPAIALQAGQAIQMVDFLSVGTNDLTQYTLAVDRTNAAVGYLGDALHPAVLKLVAHTAAAAQEAGKWAGVCGELAGDPLAIPLLVGMGITELSMSPARIPAAKDIIRRTNRARARTMVQQILELDTPRAVRDYLASFQYAMLSTQA